MAEIDDLFTSDAANIARFPEGQAPSTVNNGARALEGLIARFHKDNNGSLTTAGTSTVYTLAANRTLSAYTDGLSFVTKFHLASGASPTINVNALGAKALTWTDGTALKANDIPINAKVRIRYDGTNFQVLTFTRSYGAAANQVSVNDEPFADVASATTTDIGAATSRNVRITGTTTITGLGTVASGIQRNVRFAGILTLTHNATSLILPGSANILTAADDTAEFISLGAGNWLCMSYKRASGRPLFGLFQLGAEIAAASQTAMDFTGIPSGVHQVIVSFQTVVLSGNNNILVQLGDSGGIDATGYISTGGAMNPGSQTLVSSSAGFLVNYATTPRNCSGSMSLTRMNNFGRWASSHSAADNVTPTIFTGGGRKVLTGELDRVRFTVTAGVITGGSVNIMYL